MQVGANLDLSSKSTTNLSEGTNLYYTNVRAISAVTGSDLDMGGNKVLFGNLYSAEGDLPSASTYHGMFAHVHGTGKGYFAHAGGWKKLLDESSSDTADLTEGTNLYYTVARANTAIDARVTQSMVSSLGFAPLASPTFTGTPAAPTAANTVNTTQLATTAFVTNKITNLIGGAPGTLDTLNELAAAINDDANFSTTITNSIATKLPLAGGTMTAATTTTRVAVHQPCMAHSLHGLSWATLIQINPTKFPPSWRAARGLASRPRGGPKIGNSPPRGRIS